MLCLLIWKCNDYYYFGGPLRKSWPLWLMFQNVAFNLLLKLEFNASRNGLVPLEPATKLTMMIHDDEPFDANSLVREEFPVHHEVGMISDPRGFCIVLLAHSHGQLSFQQLNCIQIILPAFSSRYKHRT